jgi:hypothetical protein
MRAAIIAGHRYILWCDSVVQAIRHPGHVFDAIRRDGFFMRETGNVVGSWASDHCLEIMGVSREVAMSIREGAGACLGFDSQHPVGRQWFEQWCRAAERGAFNGPWDNANGQCSSDPRVRGHRHDQTVASIVAHWLGLPLNEEGLFQSAPDNWPYGDKEPQPETVLLHGGTNWWEWNAEVMARCQHPPHGIAKYWRFEDPLSTHTQNGEPPIELTAKRRTQAPKLRLPSVTLLCADGYNADRAARVLEVCQQFCDFGDVKLLSHMPNESPHWVEIQPLISHVDYSLFMALRAHEYVNTPHALVVQYDGFILNPDAWNSAWLDLDYIGPLFIQDWQRVNARSVGSGGFSLRSKRLMKAVADIAKQRTPVWDGTPQSSRIVQQSLGCYEDGLISILGRRHLENKGYRYGSPAEASRFAQGGNTNLEYHIERPFGFHGMWLRYIDFEAGKVLPWKGAPGDY